MSERRHITICGRGAGDKPDSGCDIKLFAGEQEVGGIISVSFDEITVDGIVTATIKAEVRIGAKQ